MRPRLTESSTTSWSRSRDSVTLRSSESRNCWTLLSARLEAPRLRALDFRAVVDFLRAVDFRAVERLAPDRALVDRVDLVVDLRLGCVMALLLAYLA
jgi:hypothetical protein